MTDDGTARASALACNELSQRGPAADTATATPAPRNVRDATTTLSAPRRDPLCRITAINVATALRWV